MLKKDVRVTSEGMAKAHETFSDKFSSKHVKNGKYGNASGMIRKGQSTQPIFRELARLKKGFGAGLLIHFDSVSASALESQKHCPKRMLRFMLQSRSKPKLAALPT